MGLDEVHEAMRKLCAVLEADQIPYAIAGAMALNAHGYQRVTTDVDVLFTTEGLASFKAKHLGRNSHDQVTYYGHPLYYFVSDEKPGHETGEGLNDFHVLSPAGHAIDS